ncbi:MAG TPA: PBP1A family penicillin-binding protein [Candidatus Paceibacterota bacterium]
MAKPHHPSGHHDDRGAHQRRTRRKQFAWLWPIGLVLAGLVFLGVGAGMLWVAVTPTPDISSFADRQVIESTKIYDRTGQVLLYDFGSADVRRQSVPLASISPDIRNATVAIEDSDFYSHNGIRISAIFRAILADIIPGGLTQGGSTITQQVVKNSILTNEKSITRKVHEWILAIKLEQHYTKNQILELYLNGNPYGGNIYGVETASEAYFGKSANQVDLAEAAYLAAMPQAPTYYSPYGTHRAALDERKNLVLDRMQALGYITADQLASAKAETVTFKAQQSSSIIAPHFVFYIEQYLENKYGEDVLDRGLKVVTTLDADLQKKTEDIVAQYAPGNLKNFKASNAAVVAIDPKTGQILTMVGSKDYFATTTTDGQFNAALANRQPGSAFKPFVYAAALLKGYTPETAIYDLPTQFSTACAASDNYNDTPPCYAPSNYDDKFRGPMTFTTALAQSINIPAVKTLYLAGIANVINLATRMGIDGFESPSHYGLTLALGAQEVSPLELTSAYAAFADNGIRNPPTGILSVTDSTGAVLEEYQPNPSQALDPNVAAEMSAMLSDNPARFPEYPPQNPFVFPGYDVAAKTGTTNESKDAWTVGYSPSIAIGAWAGNNDDTPMVKEIAGYIVAPMWHDIMAYALTKYPVAYFPEPPPIPDTASPALRGSYANQTANGDIEAHDILYWVDKDNPLGPPPSNPSSDPQFSHWEYPIGGSSYAGTGIGGQFIGGQ